jgi:hypothetical protein
VRKPKRKLWVAAAISIAFVLVLYGAAHLVVRSDGFRARVQSEARERTGYDVRLANLRLTPLLGIVASGLAASRDGKLLFEAATVTCFLSPFDYFHRRISRLSLAKPVLYVSLSDLFKTPAEKAPGFSIGALDIDDGNLILETGRAEPLVLRSISLTGKNVSLAGETGLQLRARLPVIDGAAALRFSGSVDEKRLEVVVTQAAERSASQTTEEKTVFEAHVQMKPKTGGGYAVNGAGTLDGFRLGAETIDGRFHSVAEVDAQLESARFSLDLKTPRLPGKLLHAGAPVAPGAVQAALQGSYSTRRKMVSLTSVNATSDVGGLEGEGTVDFAVTPALLTNTLRVRDVPLAAIGPLLPRPLDAFSYNGKLAADLSLSGAYNDAVVKGLAWSDGARIEGEKLSLSDLALKVPFERARGSIRLKGATLRGKNLLVGRKGENQLKIGSATLTGEAVKEEQKPMQLDAVFGVSQGRFSNPRETIVGENLAAAGRFSYTEREGNPFFRGQVSVTRLELLWDKFFGDFGGQKPNFEFEGRYHEKSEELNFERLALSLASVGRVDLAGSARHLLAEPVFDLRLKSADLHHEGFYDFFIRDTFKTSHPVFGQIRLTGKSNLALRAQGTPGAFALEGNWQVQQSEIEARSGEWRIGPVALNLPLKIRFPKASKDRSAEGAPAGTLSIRRVETLSTSIPEIRTPMILWNNMLRFPDPIHVRLFGGSGSIEGLGWRDAIGAPQEVSLSLKLEDLRLLDVTRSLGWYPFTGRLSASIPQVHWTGNALKSDGVVTLDLFAGRATIRGMEIESPLSPLRSIRMDAVFEDLNLEQASETFEFGRISGVLAGAIQNLVFTQGQPAEFNVNLHTVEKPGVSQWISVEALNKITVLSSGNEAGSIYGGLAGFFDFFRYGKLGFKATLKNDKLILRGVESKDGKEYLVVGTLLPPTVNIISHTQEIGFSELLRRLERVKETGAAKTSALP